MEKAQEERIDFTCENGFIANTRSCAARGPNGFFCTKVYEKLDPREAYPQKLNDPDPSEVEE